MSREPGHRCVLALGHLGGRNLGDEVMFEGLKASLDARMPVHWIVPVPDPESMSYGVNSETVALSGRSVFRAIAASDEVFICGGTTFHDNYTGDTARRHSRTMLKFVLLSLWARALGKKVKLIGIGLGPLRRSWTTRLTKAWLALASVRIVRDGASLDICRRFAIGCHSAPDLAYLYARIAPCVRSKNSDLLLSFMAHGSFAGWDTVEVDQLYEAVLQTAAQLLNSGMVGGVKLMVVGKGTVDDDLAVSEWACKKLRMLGVEAEIVDVTNPTAFLDLLARARLVVSTRLHPAIISCCYSVPVISLAYHAKIPAFWESVQASEKLFFHPNEGKAASDAMFRLAGNSGHSPNIPPDIDSDLNRLIEIVTEERAPAGRRGQQ